MMTRVINRRKRLLLVHLAVTILICSTPVLVTAQTDDRIVLNVTVTTEKGDAVLDLSRENFSVAVDKRPQNILSFNGEVSASIGILIDTSGSLYKNATTAIQLRQNLKAGLERFVQMGRPSNEYFVMTFNNDMELLQDWTTDRASVTNKLDSLEFKGQTALFDSMQKAVAKVMEGRHARHVLIVVSDGEDSYSRSQEKHVRETIKRSDVVLYALGFVDISDRHAWGYGKVSGNVSSDVFGDFANNSGGRPFFSLHYAKSVAFTQAFEAIALELRSQYQLVVSAEERAVKERWRKLNVTATRNDASGRPQKLIVRTRQGYYR